MNEHELLLWDDFESNCIEIERGKLFYCRTSRNKKNML